MKEADQNGLQSLSSDSSSHRPDPIQNNRMLVARSLAAGLTTYTQQRCSLPHLSLQRYCPFISTEYALRVTLSTSCCQENNQKI